MYCYAFFFNVGKLYFSLHFLFDIRSIFKCMFLKNNSTFEKKIEEIFVYLSIVFIKGY